MENQNSICFIAKINNIETIPNSDNIELVTLEGWKSIVAKSTYKIGDLAVCITTDAVIPDHLAAQWGVLSYLRKGNRVRTVKLRGVYSECILIPLQDIPLKLSESISNLYEGRDLMDRLEIYKYEPPVIQIQDSKGRKHRYHQNPNFHIYYKFQNAKNSVGLFNELDDVVITRKVHGSNFRAAIVKKIKLSLLDKIKKFFTRDIYINYTFSYGSHNVEKGSDAQGYYSTDIWLEMVKKYNLKEKLWKLAKSYNLDELGTGIILYGEVYGEGIQGKDYTYGLKDKSLVSFDIELNGVYLTDEKFKFSCLLMGIPIVDYLYEGKWSKDIENKYLFDNIDNIKVPHEGLIVKHISGMRNKIYKCINPNYHIFSEKNNVPDSH